MIFVRWAGPALWHIERVQGHTLCGRPIRDNLFDLRRTQTPGAAGDVCTICQRMQAATLDPATLPLPGERR